ncbi:MAG: 3-isopropylmalate dehydratase small subunit [Synergistetes bacterium]|nr:3-isopropylmalate dehydratase small subunit [Synergistota bacterium]MCX8127676.1 3-isopropylmalate dehydratase small subunit [Synergistota bacterium]MDW8191409.1 3-isopropylmalate dehydratase small subunit [Synergistota bacterium]
MLRGKAWKFGDDIDTDVIIPATYLNTTDPGELGKHCFEPIFPNFKEKVNKGDIIVAGKNFGCGSSRQHAPIAIKACGISCVIASSFARIFFRNAINIGLPILECEEASKNIENGDELEVNLEKGIIKDLTKGMEFKAEPIPESILEILSSGGLVEYVRKKLGGD